VQEPWQKRLIEAMQARGMSGSHLGRLTGFTPQYINSLRNKDRGARLPHETAQKLSHALGVSMDWLIKGEGSREAPRLSDVFPTGLYEGSAAPIDRYPSRAETIALLATSVAPEVISALRTVIPPEDQDPGRDYWIAYAKDLAKALRKIKEDPDFAHPESETRIEAKVAKHR
jgi:transcriptional regulator with XRE-family HTH domain